MRFYCGIDLHAKDCFLCVIDDQDRIHLRSKVPNHLPSILDRLEAFSPRPSVVVESTLNWYWLVGRPRGGWLLGWTGVCRSFSLGCSWGAGGLMYRLINQFWMNKAQRIMKLFLVYTNTQEIRYFSHSKFWKSQ